MKPFVLFPWKPVCETLLFQLPRLTKLACRDHLHSFCFPALIYRTSVSCQSSRASATQYHAMHAVFDLTTFSSKLVSEFLSPNHKYCKNRLWNPVEMFELCYKI